MATLVRPLLGLCACALALSCGAAAIAAETPVAEAIIELPKFEVVDDRVLPPPESWQYAEIPGYEILSSLSEKRTRHFVRDFLLLQQVTAGIMPALFRGDSPVPTAIILCDRDREFDRFRPLSNGGPGAGIYSMFLRNAERSAIVVDFTRLEPTVQGQNAMDSNPYRSFYREYFRFMIRRQLVRSAPAWYEEGLVQILSATQFSRKHVDFGQIDNGLGDYKAGDFNKVLDQRGLIPLKEFFETSRREGFWSSQAYAFVHFCLYSNKYRYQQRFYQFVQRLENEPATEKLFQECFGMNYAKMAVELRGYIQFTMHHPVRYDAKKGEELPEPPAVQLQEAPDGVVGRLKGEVFRLGGHDLPARNSLIAPYIRGERDPRLLAALGLDELEAGRSARARRFLEAAAQAKATRARAYLELARLRYTEVGAQVGAAQLDPKQTASVVDPLLTAHGQLPRMTEVYVLLSEVWQRSEVAPTSADYGVVLEGVKAFPRDASLVYAAAELGAKRGFTTEARQLAEHGLKLTGATPARERFVQLTATLAREPEKTSPEGSSPSTP